MKNVVRVFNVYTMNCAYFSTIDFAAATPRLKELTNALDSIVDWYQLGVRLGLKDHELRTISRDFRGDNERCKLEMLGRWLRNAELPTWKAVVDALQLMGEHAVAAKIQARHCSSSTDTGKYILCSFKYLGEESTQNHTHLNKKPGHLTHTVCIN